MSDSDILPDPVASVPVVHAGTSADAIGSGRMVRPNHAGGRSKYSSRSPVWIQPRADVPRFARVPGRLAALPGWFAPWRSQYQRCGA